MSTEISQNSREKTLALIAEKARTSSDRFKIVVDRRVGPNLIKMAGLDGATFGMIAEPASWLPALLGGGEYHLKVSHSVDQPGQQLGVALIESYPTTADSPAGLPKNTPSIPSMQAQGWPGPPTLFYPSRELIDADRAGKPLPWAAPQPQQGQLRQNLQMVQGAEMPQPQYDPNTQGLLAQAMQKEQEAKLAAAENMRRERELTEQKTKAEKELTEQRETIKREQSEAKLRDEMRQQQSALNEKLAMLTAASQRPPEPGLKITDVIAAVSPLLTAFMSGQNEMRLAMMKQEAENARLARESQERIAVAQREASDKQAALLTEVIKASTTKPGMSPEMGLLIDTLKEDKKSNSADAMAAMMTRMVDAVGVVSKMSIGMIETVAQQLGGDPEDPVVTAIKEGAKAMQMLSQGAQAGAARSIPQPRQMPTGARPQQQQQQQRAPQPQAQVRPQVAPQQQQQPHRGAQRPAGAAATGPQQPAPAPAPVVATPAPIGVAPVQVTHFAEASVGVPMGESGPAFEFASTEAPPLEPRQPTRVDLIERAIRGQQPAEEVAAVLVQIMKEKDPDFRAELKAVGGDPNDLLKSRLGERFVDDNALYLNALGLHFSRLGDEAGIFADEAPAYAEVDAEDAAAEAQQAEEPSQA